MLAGHTECFTKDNIREPQLRWALLQWPSQSASLMLLAFASLLVVTHQSLTNQNEKLESWYTLISQTCVRPPPAPSRNGGGCKSLCDWCSYLVALLFNCPKLKLTSWQQGACSTQTANIQKRSWGSHPRSRQERQTRQEEQDKPGQGES